MTKEKTVFPPAPAELRHDWRRTGVAFSATHSGVKACYEHVCRFCGELTMMGEDRDPRLDACPNRPDERGMIR